MKQQNQRYINFPIKMKLLISHGIILAFSILITVILLFGMIGIKNKVVGLYEGPTKNIDAIGDIRFGLTDVLRAMDRILAESGRDISSAYDVMEADVARDVNLIMSATDVLKQNLLTEEGKVILTEMLDEIEAAEIVRPQVMEVLKTDNFDVAYELAFEVYLPMVEKINEIADKLEAQIRNTAAEYYSSALEESTILIFTGIGIMAVGIIFSIIITLRITKSIVNPIREITKASERMYQGDMAAGEDIKYEAVDEIGIVAASLRGAMKNLQDYIEEISANLREIAGGDLTKDGDSITNFLGDFADIKESFVYILKRFNSTLTEIQNTSKQVAISSKEIESASRTLSEGAADQASAIEELTATIATVAGLAEESASNTQEAYNDIRQSTDKAEQEKKKMEELTEEMRRIMEISKEIENIIADIEGIASQTNLLSLNASIEAARAGDAGKGFAVVADQIGKLASDSAESAVNTRNLIKKTLEEIEKGNAITVSTSAVFEKVIDDMKSFAEIAQTTNETARNQSVALEQIEQGITQIAGAVQNTTASAEENIAISENLLKDATNLDNLVNRFELF